MRIAILGPIYTKKYFGGVATFDENLAIAYKKLDNEVVLYSKQLTFETTNKYDIIERPINLWKAFKQTVFDLIIVSLDYAIYLPMFKARKKVYFLHGFFSLSAYSPVKTIFAVAYQKFFLRYANYIISNSQFIVVHLSRQKIRHFIMNLIIQATASASSSSIAGK